METNSSVLLDLVFILLLVVLNAFFVAVQFSILHSHPSSLKQKERKKNRSSRMALWLRTRLDLSLAATQLGTTISYLLIGWFAIDVCGSLFQRLIGQLGLPLEKAYLTILAIVFGFFFVVFVQVVIGELVGKSLAVRFPDKTLKFLSGPTALFVQIIRPVSYLLIGATNVVLKLFRTSIPAKSERFPSVSELSMLVSRSTEQGIFDKDEEEMLRGIFGFSDTVAREVMTPRTDLLSIDVEAGFEELMQVIVETGFSRFPVKEGEIDNIVGILLVKDLLLYLSEDISTKIAEFDIRKVMREPYYIPGTKPIDDLLNEFKKRKNHLAIVLDEHGGVDGVVTLEDLLEEIVGDIFDESDVSEQAVVVEKNGDVVVDGGMLVTDLNERFQLMIPEGDYDTIAGFIFTSLGRMAKSGDQVLLKGLGDVEVDGVVLGKNGSDKIDAPAEHLNGFEDIADEHELSSGGVLAEIIVEKVESNRIELVRLRFPAKVEELEPSTASKASQDKGIVPDRDIS